MARWQRDPRARKRVAIVLMVVEVLLAAAVFVVLVQNYVFRLAVRVGNRDGLQQLYEQTRIVAAVLGVLFLVWLIFQAVMYVRGKEWARKAFVAINLLLVLGGVLWFALDLLVGEADSASLVQGLCLPLITVFPMTGLLLSFRPMPPRRPPGSP